MTARDASDGPVRTLERWEEFGGTWRVAFRDATRVTLSLCRCDGGEEVERLTFEDPALLAYLDARPSGEGGQG